MLTDHIIAVTWLVAVAIILAGPCLRGLVVAMDAVFASQPVKSFWLALARFAYRRWAAGKPITRPPLGSPFVRDPAHPCAGFEPRKRELGDWDCQNDNHYLCDECAHNNPPEEQP